MTGVFIDTNVFVYALDEGEPAKQARAQTLLDELGADVVVSTQVLIELHRACTHRLGLPREVAGDAVRQIASLPVVDADRALVAAAAALCEQAQLSIFDALIVRAAQRAECRTLLTEDLNSGRTFDGLVVENPFR